MEITLADGTQRELDGLSDDQLAELQFDQEQQFARQIVAAPKGSEQRDQATRQGYDTVCTILAKLMVEDDGPLVMGMDERYVQLVLKLLAERTTAERPARLFEVGYGSAAMLERAYGAGYDVGGIEVSETMRQQARAELPVSCHDELALGSLLDQDLPEATYDVIYWNDVFEHVAPDEISDYLAKLHRMLRPGGVLLTITPNWHQRPSDVTFDFCPVRTEARGLHLKEYTLREVTALLRQAGFRDVHTPLFVLRSGIYRGLGGLAGVKRLGEPALERLPFQFARLLCRGFGLAYTMAHK